MSDLKFAFGQFPKKPRFTAVAGLMLTLGSGTGTFGFDIKDKRFGRTPLGSALYGWCERPPEANHGDYYEVVGRLVAAGATVEPEWPAASRRGLPMTTKILADRRMLAALSSEIQRG